MKRNLLLIALLGLFSFLSACGNASPDPGMGQNLAVIKGCAACHSVDEATKIGPSWVGLYGSQVQLADGSLVIADDSFLIESIKEPNAKIVKGYSKGAMPKISLTEQELDTLVAYIKSVK
jgi:cytochrome c oxidase subunit 2